MNIQNIGNFIGGTWVKAGESRANINPSDISDTICETPSAGAADMEAAIDAAHSAFPAWANSTPQQRHDVLDFTGNELLARREEIGTLLSREEGKTLAEGIGETARAGQVFKFFAGEALRNNGDILDSVRPGIDVQVTREPLGVVGLITPWNFPIAIPAWKVAPALALGNTVILKAAELTPGCAYVIAEILARSGLPEGVFNLVSGRGSLVGRVLTSHPKVAAISFTGSVPTGRGIAAECGANLKKFQLEMGGKNPMVVLNDADLDIAVDACLNGAFFCTGQRCTASSRLIVERGIHDAFVEKLAAGIEALVVGEALDPATQIGPVIDESQLSKNLDYVEVAKSDGGELVTGGNRLELAQQGWYMAPALITGTSNDMRINREEVFGPVASVIKVDDFDEALAVANDTDFGLSSGICTRSLKYATVFRKRSEAGMVMVNLPTAGVDYHVPFGGRKGSSYGSREQGTYAREFYTTVKTSYVLP